MKSNKEKAENWLKNNKAEKVFATSDGFLFANEHLAQNHGRTLNSKKVETFKATAAKSGKAEKEPRFLDQSVEEITNALPAIEDLGMLEAYLNEEQKGKNARKTAIEAIQNRIEELTSEN